MKDSSALSIGEVTELLKNDFPDVTMSKVRFLENQGLIDPSRSSSGYRQYHSADVDRLQFILRQQRDHFLPLKVIKSQLARWDRGDAPHTDAPQRSPASSDSDDYEEIFEIHELARRADLSREQVRRLIDHGLLKPSEEDGVLRFGSRDAAIARQCSLLMRQGLEPRHLRGLRHTVVRHVEMLGRLSVGMRRNRNPEVRRQAAKSLTGNAEAMMRLTELLFLAEVEAILDG